MATKSLFSTLFLASEEKLKEIREKSTARNVKRKFGNGYDDASEKMEALETKIEDEVRKGKEADMSKILKAMQDIRGYKETQEDLKDLHLKLFGVEFKIDDTL